MSNTNGENQPSLANTVEARQNSEKRYRRLFESAKDGILILEADTGKVVDVNPFLLQLLGYSYGAICGQHIWELGVFKDIAASKDAFKTLQDNEYIRYENLPLETLDRRSIAVEFVSNVYQVDHAKVIQCNIRDITERKRAAEALRESGKRYKQLLESVTDYIYTVQVQDNRPLATVHGPGCAAVTGYTSEDYEADPYLWYQMVYEQDRDAVIDQAARVISGEEVSPLEHRIIHRDGSIRWVRNTPVPHYDERRELIAYDGLIANITERKQAEEALAEEAIRRRILFEQSRDGIVVLDQNGKVYEANQRYAEMLGYSAEEISELHVWDWDIQWTQENLLERMRLADAEGSVFETRHRRKDGTIYDVEISHNGVELAGQKLVFCVCRDISQRKAAEQVLQENQSQLDLALRSANMGVWQWDLIKDKHFFDDQVCRLLGIDQAKFTGTADEFFNAVHPDDREVLKAALARAIGQDVPYETEYRAVWPDGSVHYIIARAKLFRDPTGQAVRVKGLAWDFTERKRAEEEKEKIETQLRQSQKMEAIGMLAGGIAHDFNNILQPIIGYTEMELLELSPSSPLRGSLERVLNASLRAKELIRQILAISRSTQEQQRMPADISSIIQEALNFLRSSLPTSIEMRQKIRKGVALADQTQIHQVLMNLCTNAAHAMDGKGILEVRLSPVDLSQNDLDDQLKVDLKPGAYLRLTVSDTGCGMDAETMERIFDPYFTTKEVGKGSGLGLAVVHGIVKRHGGAVTVRSEPGTGTTFSVYIPRLETATPIPIETPREAPIGTESILLLDDEQTIVEMGTAILEELGYKVTTETDSLRALEVFSARPNEFDLIITDYTMPNLTGLDLAKKIRRLRPDIPILLCTGFSEKITPNSVKELGIGLLMKPYGMGQISEAVRKILDAQKGG